MTCCLNPKCKSPQNPDDANVCQSCGATLTPLLRGRYRPQHPIGQGGFGRTYLALDEDRLGTRCVVKQFSPQVQGTKSLEKAVRLFNQEAVRLDELGEHPQIPTLLAYFEQDNYLYLVQQFVEGQSLLQEMRQTGAFGERQIRDVLADILPVLRFVHQRQVIHRDITPTNILRRQGDRRLVLIDFGVAKQLSDAPVATGTRIGTEGYAPIEQFRSGRAYPASDLYSLGATCIHLMTQVRPDNLYDPLEGRWTWREYLAEKGTLVSDQLAHILNQMLKDLVSERYQSADEVMRDLNADYFMPTSRPRRSPAAQPSASPSPRAAAAPQAAAPQRAASPVASPARPSNPPTSAPPTSAPPTSALPTSAPPTSRPPLVRPTVPQISGWRCIHTLVGHASWVTSVAVDEAGSVVVSGSLDDTVKVWNLTQGNLLFNLAGHSRDVNAVAISPDGRTLLSAGDDCLIKAWYLPTGAPLRNLSGHSRDVNALAVSPDGRLLISGGEDRTIRLWSLANGAVVKVLPGVLSMIKAIAVSQDGRTFASGGLDNKVRIWSLQTGEQLRLLSGHVSAVNALAFHPDGLTLASGSRDKSVKIWNLQTSELLHNLTDHTREVNALAFSPDGKTLFSGSSDATIKLWDVATGRLIDTLVGHGDSVNAIALSGNGRYLASGSSDNTVRVWQH